MSTSNVRPAVPTIPPAAESAAVAANVRSFLTARGLAPLVFAARTPDSAAAAAAVGCCLGEIAKSVLMVVGERPVLVVTSGDTRVKSGPLKQASGLRGRVRLPQPEEVPVFTGYAAGSVSPFLLPPELPVLLDRSLQRFDRIYPAAGDDHSAVGIAPADLQALCRGEWATVCAVQPDESIIPGRS